MEKRIRGEVHRSKRGAHLIIYEGKCPFCDKITRIEFNMRTGETTVKDSCPHFKDFTPDPYYPTFIFEGDESELQKEEKEPEKLHHIEKIVTSDIEIELYTPVTVMEMNGVIEIYGENFTIRIKGSGVEFVQ